MNARTTRWLSLLGLAMPLLALASNQCTSLTALPATLSDAGVYCLTDDLQLTGSSGTAITIAADAVTLDLDGHALRSKASANASTIGVSVVGRKYFNIVNGTLAGFAQAVYVRSNGDTPAKGGCSRSSRCSAVSSTAYRLSAMVVSCATTWSPTP